MHLGEGFAEARGLSREIATRVIHSLFEVCQQRADTRHRELESVGGGAEELLQHGQLEEKDFQKNGI